MNDSEFAVRVERVGFDNLLSAVFWAGLPCIALALAVFATVRRVRSGQQGLALIYWLLLIWLMPIIGPILALYSIRRPASASC